MKFCHATLISNSTAIQDRIGALARSDKWSSTSQIVELVDDHFFRNAVLICHKEAVKEAAQLSFEEGLRQTPSLEPTNGTSVLTGANEVAREVASFLTKYVEDHSHSELIVPQMYSAQDDPANEQFAREAEVSVEGIEVSYVFRSPRPD